MAARQCEKLKTLKVRFAVNRTRFESRRHRGQHAYYHRLLSADRIAAAQSEIAILEPPIV